MFVIRALKLVFVPRLVCLTQLRVSGMWLCVRRGGCTPSLPGRLAAVVLSGAGGGGSTTQELSRNQNSRLAPHSADTSLSVILLRTFSP